MKNNALTLLLSLFSLLFTAQMSFSQGEGAITAGGGLIYGSEIETLGIGLNGQYFITDNLAGQVGLNFFFPNKESVSVFEQKSSLWTINLNGNYYFDISNEKIKPYALGGINIANYKFNTDFPTDPDFEFESDFSKTYFGLNIGGGADFYVTEKFTPFAQLKYVISDLDQLVLMAGVRFNIY